MSVFRVSAADKGDFAGERLAWDVLKATAKHRVSVPPWIDLSQCVMLKPYSIACLIAMGAKSGRRTPLTLPTNPQCLEHVVRIGLPQWFEMPSPPSLESRATNVVARQLESRPSSSFSDDVVQVLSGELRLSVGIASALATHLDEVVLNAVTHANSPIGCIVVGQAFPQNGCMEVAVVDLGQTIRGHLITNPEHAGISTDAEAIIQATTEGVTGTVGTNRWGERNSGVGLYELRHYCESGGGEMTILSGDSFVTFQSEKEPKVHQFHGGFAGCLVNVRFFAR
jgi:anti-sigma regulatory factor (Ser/Thr protein kinase)